MLLFTSEGATFDEIDPIDWTLLCCVFLSNDSEGKKELAPAGARLVSIGLNEGVLE